MNEPGQCQLYSGASPPAFVQPTGMILASNVMSLLLFILDVTQQRKQQDDHVWTFSGHNMSMLVQGSRSLM